MFAHPAVQAQPGDAGGARRPLRRAGEGYLACGWIGKGRLAEPEDVVAAADASLTPPRSPLRRPARRWSPPARPTRTSIRFATSAIDRAAGWDIALAAAARAPRRRRDAGRRADGAASRRPAVEVVRVRSAAEMHAGRDAGAAADGTSSSWPPPSPTTRRSSRRRRRSPSRDGPLMLTLTRTPDILADLGAVARRRRRVRSWSASPPRPHDVLAARPGASSTRKGVDLIVANDVTPAGAGFDTTPTR